MWSDSTRLSITPLSHLTNQINQSLSTTTAFPCAILCCTPRQPHVMFSIDNILLSRSTVTCRQIWGSILVWSRRSGVNTWGALGFVWQCLNMKLFWKKSSTPQAVWLFKGSVQPNIKMCYSPGFEISVSDISASTPKQWSWMEFSLFCSQHLNVSYPKQGPCCSG